MPTENTITISVERFQQLIRAEQDANQLKSIISDCHENYHILSREEINLLYVIHVGNKEDNHV